MARLASIALAFVVAWFAPIWALVPVGAFIILIFVHEPVIKARRRAIAAAAFCERGIARMSNAWRGRGDRGSEFADDHHPFSGDLDLFGEGSLFELVSIATTAAGRRILAELFRSPGGDIRERQQSVDELRDRLDLREELAVLAGEVRGDIESADLGAWSTAPVQLVSRGERLVGIVIAVLNVITLVPAVLTFVNGRGTVIPFFVMVGVTFMFQRRVRPRVDEAIGAVSRREPALALLARLVARLERERFTSPRLAKLHATLQREGEPASKQIDRLRRLVALLDSARNQMFAPFAGLMLWNYQVAWSIERWRARAGRSIVEWIDAVGELEALASLASFAFEHPSFVMPEIVDGPALFDAIGAGHPLIDEEKRVTNDVTLGAEPRLLIISGSNMSGKSTMLRTIGVNTVLALAGAPVCATSLRIAPMAVGASIRIHDSLQEGASRFYAEILRIRQVLELANSGQPLLFLLDEILHGTNSHDRRVGAEAIVRGLVERGAIGCVSTHDLTLAEVADALAPRAANVHFEDQFEAGEMRFDYRMRPGVVRRSNALALMRTIGIEIPPSS
ncbi:MAG: hypothetical protein QOI24_2568 [Acidobacteriota bacterium]|nr:hypothetical protein [Acidobacteriota bacterium]